MKKKHRFPADPAACSEAEKYSNPIPSREYILQVMRTAQRPLQLPELLEHFDMTDDEIGEVALSRRLRAMVRDGQLLRNRRRRYALVEKLELVQGVIYAKKEEIVVSISSLGLRLPLVAADQPLVFDLDKVLVKPVYAEDRPIAAEIVEFLERKLISLTGQIVKQGNDYFLLPKDNKIGQRILLDNSLGQLPLVAGEWVEAKIITYPTAVSCAIATVTNVLGDIDERERMIHLVVKNYHIPHTWSAKILEAVKKLPDAVTQAALSGRLDLRSAPFVTVDGKDAKDFDDAVYCEYKQSGGWCLYVAIADVSYYVAAGSSIDVEAQKRANSVYFPGKVIPMLPEHLANHLCSLQPNVDRLSFVAIIDVTKDGELKSYKFQPAVICSKARLTYETVQEIWDDPAILQHTEQAALLPHLQELLALYTALQQHRLRRGAIDFITLEPEIIFGSDHKIAAIKQKARLDSHKMIEECMLLANVAAADFALKHKLPVLYRNHANPPEEKLTALRNFLQPLGVKFPTGDKITSKQLSKFISSITNRKDYAIIQTVILRSMAQAEYSPENVAHFGLAYDAYTHFTSPIRRYPDLLLHRQMHYFMQHDQRFIYPKVLKTLTKAQLELAYDKKHLQMLGEECSVAERRADEAARDVIDWLKCEFMRDKVGKSYHAKVVSVTHFGLFLELTEFYIDGLLHVTALADDYYHHDADRHCLRGERTGRVYSLGDILLVRVARVDVESRHIDFALQQAAGETTQRARTKRNKRK